MVLKEIKTKEDRVKEGVALLKQLKSAGVSDTSIGFLELKEKINAWVKSEHSWEGTVSFPEYNRVAEVDLPRYNNRAAGINFKVKRVI